MLLYDVSFIYNVVVSAAIYSIDVTDAIVIKVFIYLNIVSGCSLIVLLLLC